MKRETSASLLDSLIRSGDAPDPEKAAEASTFFNPGEKPRFVQGVFDRIAVRYDLLNTITSFGMHHFWRKRAIQAAALHPGQTALDIACGTGDFIPGLKKAVSLSGTVIGLDFSRPMLEIADQKLEKRRIANYLVQADAEKLPFRSKSVDAITIGFALRNIADVAASFREMNRVLVPGGRLVALEIARPGWWPYRPLFLFYFERLLPLLARVFRGEKTAYRWLPASLAAFYSRDGVINLLQDSGFGDIKLTNLAGGAVCIYKGIKL